MDYQPTVYLVDDDRSILEALVLALTMKGYNVEAFDSASSFLQSLNTQPQGCLVLDFKMPEMNGLDLQQVLSEKQIEIPIIFITGHGDVSTSAKAFKAGAIEFLEKPFDLDVISQRIKDAFTLDVEKHKKRVKDDECINKFNRLTSREKEIMMLLVTGRPNSTNKNIAKKLGISYRTVEVHRKSVMSKMQVTSLIELVELAKNAKP